MYQMFSFVHCVLFSINFPIRNNVNRRRLEKIVLSLCLKKQLCVDSNITRSFSKVKSIEETQQQMLLLTPIQYEKYF